MSHENDETQPNVRRRGKLIAFIISEGAALAILVPSLAFGMLRHTNDPSLALSMNVLTIAAASAVAIIPILFYAIASPVSRDQS